MNKLKLVPRAQKGRSLVKPAGLTDKQMINSFGDQLRTQIAADLAPGIPTGQVDPVIAAALANREKVIAQKQAAARPMVAQTAQPAQVAPVQTVPAAERNVNVTPGSVQTPFGTAPAGFSVDRFLQNQMNSARENMRFAPIVPRETPIVPKPDRL